MERRPVEPKKRKRIELGIRAIDIICYSVVVISGIYAWFFTPTSVTEELRGVEWLIPLWATMLLLGGVLGLAGRISTIWLIEPAACFISAGGILIYFVVLGAAAFSSVTAAVATCFVFTAFLGVVRRYLELQLFGSDPTHRTLRAKAKDALERRIPNVPQRDF